MSIKYQIQVQCLKQCLLHSNISIMVHIVVTVTVNAHNHHVMQSLLYCSGSKEVNIATRFQRQSVVDQSFTIDNLTLHHSYPTTDNYLLNVEQTTDFGLKLSIQQKWNHPGLCSTSRQSRRRQRAGKQVNILTR